MPAEPANCRDPLTADPDGMSEAQPAPMMNQSNAPVASIAEGDAIILDVNGEKQAFLTVKRAG